MGALGLASSIQGSAGPKILGPPFTGHRRVEARTQSVVPNRSDGAAPFEMTELDNDDVILLNERMHPVNYGKVVKIRTGEASNKVCAYSIHRC